MLKGKKKRKGWAEGGKEKERLAQLKTFFHSHGKKLMNLINSCKRNGAHGESRMRKRTTLKCSLSGLG